MIETVKCSRWSSDLTAADPSAGRTLSVGVLFDGLSYVSDCPWCPCYRRLSYYACSKVSCSEASPTRLFVGLPIIVFSCLMVRRERLRLE